MNVVYYFLFHLHINISYSVVPTNCTSQVPMFNEKREEAGKCIEPAEDVCPSALVSTLGKRIRTTCE
jgi:hypothetical protein